MIVLSDKIEEEFRKTIEIKYKGRRGGLSIAMEEAIMDWLEKQK